MQISTLISTRQDITYVGLACVTTNLRDQQINTERCVFVLEVLLKVMDLWTLVSSAGQITKCRDTYILTQDLRCISNTSNNAQSSRICDSSSEFRTSSYIHACIISQRIEFPQLCSNWRVRTCKQNGVLDIKQVGNGGLNDRHGGPVVGVGR